MGEYAFLFYVFPLIRSNAHLCKSITSIHFCAAWKRKTRSVGCYRWKMKKKRRRREPNYISKWIRNFGWSKRLAPPIRKKRGSRSIIRWAQGSFFTRPRYRNPLKLHRAIPWSKPADTHFGAQQDCGRTGILGIVLRTGRPGRCPRYFFPFFFSRCHGWGTEISIFSPWASRRTRRTRDSSRRIFLTRRTGRYKWNTLNDGILAPTSVKCPRRRP